MIYIKLFLTFLEIGAVSFGGGYGMISLMREKSLMYGWLTEGELLNFIGVAESTPGPIAVNMATFIGSSQAGFFGSLCATVGVVLPSFIIIMLIAALFGNLIKYKSVKAFLSGVRPCVVALIFATGVTMLVSKLVGISTVSDNFSADFIGISIFALIVVFALLYKKFKKKKPSPILLIGFSAVLGAVLYSLQ